MSDAPIEIYGPGLGSPPRTHSVAAELGASAVSDAAASNYDRSVHPAITAWTTKVTSRPAFQKARAEITS